MSQNKLTVLALFLQSISWEMAPRSQMDVAEGSKSWSKIRKKLRRYNPQHADGMVIGRTEVVASYGPNNSSNYTKRDLAEGTLPKPKKGEVLKLPQGKEPPNQTTANQDNGNKLQLTNDKGNLSIKIINN